ncbi:hypothetical protein [Paraconexibacter algicola]|uniref:DUF3072 domain-containing protein n=1 Tax=Paraconexibacter algicola TaxID=2133960 RepID=A0A2T4UM11_9ACTN|nr:hypothetical protein [Paraconexibacter algicola]PTL60265.1 hypothetical protein C7Y72_11760 [Paraconexibacter algicola]
MSEHHKADSSKSGPPPTSKQLRYLRQLALDRGVSFTPPNSKADASRQIAALKARTPDSRSDRTREIRNVQRDMQSRGDAARVRDHELEGHGSTAAWKERNA